MATYDEIKRWHETTGRSTDDAGSYSTHYPVAYAYVGELLSMIEGQDIVIKMLKEQPQQHTPIMKFKEGDQR